MVNPQTVRPAELKIITRSSDQLEMLLFEWLEDIVYIKDADCRVFHDAFRKGFRQLIEVVRHREEFIHHRVQDLMQQRIRSTKSRCRSWSTFGRGR